MLLYQIASWKTPANWARNLHRLIHTWGLSLMVTPTTVMCPVKFRSAVTTTPWPILHLSTWLRVIFRKTNAKFLCNGIPLHQGWGKELEAFWSLYKCVCPTHAVYDRPERLAATLPFLYHGDEGRGRHNRAVLVTSFQPLLLCKGHSFLSRLLCSVFPGERYATSLDGVESLECLHTEVAKDLHELFENGIEAGYA